MFTGIVTEVGRIAQRRDSARERAFGVACAYSNIVVGESIAVNGTCLTVTGMHTGGGFTATAADETLRKTTLGTLDVGTRVNLERALAIGDRLGGHIVTGHVDGVGEIVELARVGEAVRWRVKAPVDVHRFVAAKGSITIDGVSLTVNALHADGFEVLLVPFTLGATTFGRASAGQQVNLEVDVIARYVARLLQGSNDASSDGGVSFEFLERAGFVNGGEQR